MKKIVVNNHLFVCHPALGWLMPGSWDWQRIVDSI